MALTWLTGCRLKKNRKASLPPAAEGQYLRNAFSAEDSRSAGHTSSAVEAATAQELPACFAAPPASWTDHRDKAPNVESYLKLVNLLMNHLPAISRNMLPCAHKLGSEGD